MQPDYCTGRRRQRRRGGDYIISEHRELIFTFIHIFFFFWGVRDEGAANIETASSSKLLEVIQISTHHTPSAANQTTVESIHKAASLSCVGDASQTHACLGG
jgi:hypothetical protein